MKKLHSSRSRFQRLAWLILVARSEVFYWFDLTDLTMVFKCHDRHVYLTPQRCNSKHWKTEFSLMGLLSAKGGHFFVVLVVAWFLEHPSKMGCGIHKIQVGWGELSFTRLVEKQKNPPPDHGRKQFHDVGHCFAKLFTIMQETIWSLPNSQDETVKHTHSLPLEAFGGLFDSIFFQIAISQWSSPLNRAAKQSSWCTLGLRDSSQSLLVKQVIYRKTEDVTPRFTKRFRSFQILGITLKSMYMYI